jgi:hypothetical protein
VTLGAKLVRGKGRKRMRSGGVVAALVGLIMASTGEAQVVAPPPAVNQEGMINFCIYANQIYSLGAQLCVPGSNVPLRCAASTGAKSGGRAFWAFDNKEWPTATGGRCDVRQ